MHDPPRPDADEAWYACVSRDRRRDGDFVVAVLTTGIYCKPSCQARCPHRENVEFYTHAADASAAGFRACLRCRPDDLGRDREAVLRSLELVAQADGPVSLAQLAEETGYTPTHIQRLFRRDVGISPAQYGKALRARGVEARLREAATITAALYDAGFSSSSRFYDLMEGRLGMTASAWKDGGRGVTIRWAVVETWLGAMLVAATDKGVCRLSFGEGRAALEQRFPNAELEEGGEEFARLVERVVAAVERPGDARHIPLDVQGTAFQEAVWQALREIPAGETRSYAQIAAAVGKPTATRAAGSANGANNVAVLIPCHRVVRSDGNVGGYAYGPEIKTELLRRERAAVGSQGKCD
ncbi:MAG: bifunctional DNA-binding transcriptional regulator/O6-methylguanine-DNA methyltransferase Ada [Parerythrobacter sp.]